MKNLSFSNAFCSNGLYLYTSMGRKKLNRTKEELNELNQNRVKKHYLKHRESIIKKRMQRYWDLRAKEQN